MSRVSKSARTYDNQGRVVHVEEPFGVTLTFGYAQYGYRNLVLDSLGGIERSVYDAYGHLLSRVLTQGNTTLRIEQAFDADGRLTSQSRYTGATLVALTVYGYDSDRRIASIVHKDANEQTIGDYYYQYDDADQITSILDHGVLREFGYDDQGQLLSEDETNYSYDLNGNRDPMDGYVFGDNNQLLSDPNWNYWYDDEGNLAGKEEIATGVTWSYQYDHANQLVHAERRTTANGYIELSVDYTYDVFHNRIAKEIDSDGEGEEEPEVQRFALDGWNPAKPAPVGNENWDIWADTDGTGSLATRYLRTDAVDQAVARILANGDGFFDFTDHLGSLRDILTADCVTHEQVTYDAFGNIAVDSDLRGRYSFTGREYDAEIELQYNRARYYDPTTARWISQDPMGFDAGDSNLYRYVHNRVSSTLDPSGLEAHWLTPRNPPGYFSIDLQSFPADGRHSRIIISEVKVLWERLATIKEDLLGYKLGSTSKAAEINRWFGQGKDVNKKRLDRVLKVIEGVQRGLADSEVGFLHTNSDYALAWVNPLYSNIRIGKDFWTQKTARQIGILFHEMTHRFLDTDDHGYFTPRSLTSASFLPTYVDADGGYLGFLTVDQLVNNADTYEGFLEAYYLPPSIVPDHSKF